MLVHLF